MTKTFISYSHDSPEHTKRVLQLANALRGHGIDAELDQYHVRPPKGWPHWCEAQLRPENSAFVLMVCTETYPKRVQDKVSANEGRGVFWEGAIIYDYVYDAKRNTRFVPVLFSDGSSDFIPTPIRNHTRYRIGEFELTDPGYQSLYRELTGQPIVSKPGLGAIVSLLPDARPSVQIAAPLPSRPVLSAFIPADISKIVKYAPAKLVGREAETKLLDDAWEQAVQGTVPRANVLTFVALGGERKTSLVAKWAAGLASRDWAGCEAVFAWSFYSQGTREPMAASSDVFLREALTFFGDAATADSAQAAHDKGRRLAQLAGERRALLILDGLEPLQYAPTSPAPGELRDPGLAALLTGLAARSHGLCVVTTRYSIPDLKAFWQTTAPEVKLLRLSRAAGVHLLKTLGVTGSERRTLTLPGDKEPVNEFEALVEEVQGHALTLNIMGAFLKRAQRGDIRRRDLVTFEKADEKIDGGHAFRAMDAYVNWMTNDTPEAQRELAILRLLGLFDRPATADCLAGAGSRAGGAESGVAGRAPAAVRTPLREYAGRGPAHARSPPTALPGGAPRLPRRVAAGGV